MYLSKWVAVEDSVALLVSYRDARRILIVVAALLLVLTIVDRSQLRRFLTHQEVWMPLVGRHDSSKGLLKWLGVVERDVELVT